MGRGWYGWWGGWAVGGRLSVGGGLNPLLGLFVLAMSSRSASHRPKHAYMA